MVRECVAARKGANALCDWACMGGCDFPEMTADEIDLGYCSGRRCKSKMYPKCTPIASSAMRGRVGQLWMT